MVAGQRLVAPLIPSSSSTGPCAIVSDLGRYAKSSIDTGGPASGSAPFINSLPLLSRRFNEQFDRIRPPTYGYRSPSVKWKRTPRPKICRDALCKIELLYLDTGADPEPLSHAGPSWLERTGPTDDGHSRSPGYDYPPAIEVPGRRLGPRP